MTGHWTFVAAALAVLLTPGLGVMYVVTRSVDEGRRAGLLSVLGLASGALLHVVAATLGLSALVLASPTAFGIVKFLGAAYLVFLGVRALWAGEPTASAAPGSASPPRQVYAGGVLVSLFNPKLALFFLAFLPQFVEPRGAPVPQQVLVLGLIYIALALVTDSAYAMLAASMGARFRRGLLRAALLRYVSGVVYLGLGLSTALISRQH